VKRTTGFYPRLRVDTRGGSAVGQAGGVLLTSTVRAGAPGCSAQRGVGAVAAGAVHDPAKALLDLAMTLA